MYAHLTETHQQFRDFVCTRFTNIEVAETELQQYEDKSQDKQWQQEVTIVLVPHPSLGNPLAIEMDYGMEEGVLRLQVKAALTSYLLRQWQVDCSKDHRIVGQGCQLALANYEDLQGIENIHLAPGYAAK